MSLFARLLGAVLCVGTLASPLPVIADAAPIDMATDVVCKLDRIREIVGGAIQHSQTEEEANRLILENTADWLPDYNAFATSPEAADLRAATDAATGNACRQLLPFAAVSASALAVLKAGGAVESGSVLAPCESGGGTCVPPAAIRILERCNFLPFTLPFRASC
jgi:hypothetical protein